jgi:hypothetical protein
MDPTAATGPRRPLGKAVAVQFDVATGKIARFTWLADDQPVDWFPSDEARVVDRAPTAEFPGFTHRVTKQPAAGDSRGLSYWLVAYDES